jgi:transposase
LIVDGQGLPLAVDVTAGQQHESTRFENVVNSVRVPRQRGRPRSRPDAIAGDKGYSFKKIRDWLAAHRIQDVIPTPSNQKKRPGFDKKMYRRRNAVERCVGWLKESRRIATRFEKLALNYLGMLKLAMIHRYLRLSALASC